MAYRSFEVNCPQRRPHGRRRGMPDDKGWITQVKLQIERTALGGADHQRIDEIDVHRFLEAREAVDLQANRTHAQAPECFMYSSSNASSTADAGGELCFCA